jgi:redox-sensitive bicupin YhaK (pirin superfamily)
MSGPVSTDDVPVVSERETADAGELEVLEGRATEVGGFRIRRMLPQRPRRTVGAWCFVDHMGPGTVEPPATFDIGPHPHIGLQTVTWLLSGTVLHRDSLGSEQLIRPGQLNLMTAGHGVSHAEETTGTFTGELHGMQLWVAQPESTRDAAPAFEHHADLPMAELPGATATVLVGDYLDAASPARRDTDHLGVDLVVRPGGCVLPLDATYEHAVVVMQGRATIDGTVLEPGRLGYLGVERGEVAIDADDEARILLLGGTPFPEPILMWWNYVARTQAEIGEAHRAWSSRDERFGVVDSALTAIHVSGPPWSSEH